MGVVTTVDCHAPMQQIQRPSKRTLRMIDAPGSSIFFEGFPVLGGSHSVEGSIVSTGFLTLPPAPRQRPRLRA